MTPDANPSTEPSDRDLVLALLDGDRAAGNRLIERNYTQVYRTLVKLTGNDDLAADLTQDAFKRAWTSLRSFRAESSFSSWMYRIAYTTFLNHIRRPHLVYSVDTAELESQQEVAEGALHRISRHESEDRLRSAVVALPDRQRLAVTAKFWGELSTSEIANLEQVSAVAIRKRIRNALSTLGKALDIEPNSLKSISCVGGTAS